VIAAFRERFNKAPPPNQFKIYIESEVRIFWVYGDFSATLYMNIFLLVVKDSTRKQPINI